MWLRFCLKLSKDENQDWEELLCLHLSPRERLRKKEKQKQVIGSVFTKKNLGRCIIISGYIWVNKFLERGIRQSNSTMCRKSLTLEQCIQFVNELRMIFTDSDQEPFCQGWHETFHRISGYTKNRIIMHLPVSPSFQGKILLVSWGVSYFILLYLPQCSCPASSVNWISFAN